MNIAIQPIELEQQNQVIAETRRWIRLAEQLFTIQLPDVTVKFDLKGRSAGMFKVKNGEHLIRYNAYVFAKYYKDNLQTTIPHEVAHFVTYVRHGRRGIKPHGRQWQTVMQKFGVDAKITCDYDLTGIPQRQVKRINYKCQCQNHQLTQYRHNRIQRGLAAYFCKACRQALRPA